jgi:septum formation inhibitor MinC
VKKSRLKDEIRYIKNCLADCQRLVARTKIEAAAENEALQAQLKHYANMHLQMFTVSQKRPNWANEIQSADFKKWHDAQDDADNIGSATDANEVLTIFARFDKRKKARK